eukprot:1176194-Prorocentrum_minimum.AAC.5
MDTECAKRIQTGAAGRCDFTVTVELLKLKARLDAALAPNTPEARAALVELQADSPTRPAVQVGVTQLLHKCCTSDEYTIRVPKTLI